MTTSWLQSEPFSPARLFAKLFVFPGAHWKWGMLVIEIGLCLYLAVFKMSRRVFKSALPVRLLLQSPQAFISVTFFEDISIFYTTQDEASVQVPTRVCGEILTGCPLNGSKHQMGAVGVCRKNWRECEWCVSILPQLRLCKVCVCAQSNVLRFKPNSQVLLNCRVVESVLVNRFENSQATASLLW